MPKACPESGGAFNSLSLAYGSPAPLLRRATLVGTRSPYSLPFAILPVPARSPFRFIVHRTRSTPNLNEGAFRSSLQAHKLASLTEGGGFCEAKDGGSQPALKGEVGFALAKAGGVAASLLLFSSTPQSNLRFASSPAREPFYAPYNLSRSPAVRWISRGEAIFHCASAQFHPAQAGFHCGRKPALPPPPPPKLPMSDRVM